jgi:ribosome maturation factor RimP
VDQRVGDPTGRLARVEAALSGVLVSHGLALVDLEYQREGRRWVLRLFVDKAGGVSVGDCQRVSHEAGDVLDVAGVIEESYDLEVSSPGLDRELRTDREYAWATGKDVKCWLREAIDGRTELTGVLAAVRPEEIVVRDPDGVARTVARRHVARARLVPDLRMRRP